MRRLGLLLMGLSLCLACSDSQETKQNGGSGPWGPGQGQGTGSDTGGGGGGSGLPSGWESCADSTLTAGVAKAANIVWVIDTSRSMDQEAALVQDNMNRFVESMVDSGLQDHRVVVVSQRTFVSVPEPLGSDAEHFLFIEENVRSNEPLEDLLSRFKDYQSFLLPGAITHFVVVTDDESDIPASTFTQQMGLLLEGAPFRVHAIASPEPSGGSSGPIFGGWGSRGCVGTYGNAAAPGLEHYAAADATDGLKFSICEADWSGLFSSLATEVGESAKIPCELPIPTGEEANPWLLNLVVTDAAGKQHVISNVNRDECGAGGFSYDDSDHPTRILFCPNTCSALASATKLDIVVGCATEIL